MPVNDPQWGRRGGADDRGGSGGNQGDGSGNRNQGPPDLDELWRNFNDRLGALFGRKRSGGSGDRQDRPPSNMRQFGSGAVLLVVLVFIVWMASGYFIVDARQRAVVLTFGRYTRTAAEGLNWRWPYPIQSDELVNIQLVRRVLVGYHEAGGVSQNVPRESLMLTKNLNIVDVEFEVQYVAVDAQDFVFADRAPEDTVKQVAETAMREVVGNNEVDFILYGDRTAIQEGTKKLMQEILDRYKIGIEVRSVNIQGVNPPEQVRAAFDDVVRARQDSSRLINEGEAYANGVIPGARGTASRLLQEASGYRDSIVDNAEGEASRFRQILSEYEKAPAVTRERMYLSALQDILSSTTKVIVDTKSTGNLLFLPIDKIMREAGAATSGAGSDASGARQTPAEPLSGGASDSAHTRDLLRNRDRDQR
jgi:membrane protease subunit HflK